MNKSNQYSERLKMSFQMWMYAIQRIDLLIISLSGAGVYVVLEALKFFAERQHIHGWMIKVSGVLFLIAIVLNFISQFVGKRANHHDMLMWDSKIELEEYSGDELCRSKIEKEIGAEDTLARIYTGWTNGLNLTSLVFLLLGMVFLVTFFMITF